MATRATSSKQKGPEFAIPGWLGLPASLFVIVCFYALLLLASNDDLVLAPEHDADLCPVAESTDHHTVLLLDLRKPFGEQAHLPATITRRVANALEDGSELEVFVLGARAAEPRKRVARLCKPFRNDELSVVAAKGRSGTVRDCDDIPAQLPPATRERVAAFCARREELAARVDRLAATSAPLRAIRSTPLVEAIEETRAELDGHARPAAIYILSDMLQHSACYSHLALAPGEWDHDAFVAACSSRPVATSGNSELNIMVFYLPGRIAEYPSGELACKAFWRKYFDGAGTLTFDDQGAVPAAAERHQARL